MQVSSRDASCRYVPAVGTQTDDRSAFGSLLKGYGVVLPSKTTLARLVELGWLEPILRVALPREPFEAWEDYPNLSMLGVENTPPEHRWALDIYADAVARGPASDNEEWWRHFLDDPAAPLNRAARAHQVSPVGHVPETLRHKRFNQVVRLWIDYFAYWQVMLVADLVDAAAVTTHLLEEGNGDVVLNPLARTTARDHVKRVIGEWQRAQPTFEWLSRVRSALGASMSPERSWTEIAAAFTAIAGESVLTPEQVKAGIRDTLLVLWREKSDPVCRPRHWDTRLLALLRQDIEYALVFLEVISGAPPDFLDEFWYDGRWSHEWARLIDAFPKEEELARASFPQMATIYLKQVTAISAIASLGEPALREVVTRHWTRSRALRRFVLAFHRLHEELHGQALMRNEATIAAAERIEQFNLTMLHTERVLSAEYRERRSESRYPEIRKLAKDTLNHLLCHSGVGGAIRVTAQARAQALLEERAHLHELDADTGLPVICSADVGAGDQVADTLVGALVNFVIARNYAAHHDSLDFELVHPVQPATGLHAGHAAITSALVVVVAVLLVRDGNRI